jgi:NAD(P)H-hydrate epimerase
MTGELLTVHEMYRADRLAMAAGVSGERLMEAAGWAVAREAERRLPRCRLVILCGPGNNGGDGFVAARLLARRGWAVRLALLGSVEALTGDARRMAERWRGRVEPLSPECLDGCGGVVDALFGAGLARPLAGVALAVVAEIGRRGLPVVAVDVPSGLHGDTGEIWGGAPDAVATVTFFRKKPGHCLLPGRRACGEVVVADIGIPVQVLDEFAPDLHENSPALWRVPAPGPLDHKYSRGHAVVVGGGAMTGAARLAARAARRMGAGLVTIAAPESALVVYRAGDPGTIVEALDPFERVLSDPRRNALLLGPGAGVGEGTSARIEAVVGSGRACVLDADALHRPLPSLSDRIVLTPHDGEFRRLFGAVSGSRLVRAREGARRSGAVLLLKGADTVVAHPSGRAVICTNAPPDLATAGAGDVLAGMLLGLLAQGMDAFAAAAAAAWLHGEAARRAGRGLIAEDLAEMLPAVLSQGGDAR